VALRGSGGGAAAAARNERALGVHYGVGAPSSAPPCAQLQSSDPAQCPAIVGRAAAPPPRAAPHSPGPCVRPTRVTAPLEINTPT
jgi:hypothetical protein